MHKATNIFVETLYSVFACAYKQEELIIGLPPANWTTDRLPYVCFWDARRTQGGYWNWSAILQTFCEADCGVGIRCNGCGHECIGCRHLLFWEFVLRGLRNLAPKILKLVSGQVAVIFTFQWHVGRMFLGVVFSCRPSCCWRPGLFELWRGTLARTWAFWSLPSLTRSSVAAF